jgi:hypothetical protein
MGSAQASCLITGERSVKIKSQMVIASLCAAATMLAACGSNDNNGSSSYKSCGAATSGGGLLQPFTAPCTDQGSNAILVTASGEVLALGGYDFPPGSADAVAFVDGWEVRFSKVLVTFDRVTLSNNPDLSPSDESQTGALVAQEDGPWAVDLHKGGPLTGKGGSDERAVPITAFVNQNKNGNAAFDPTQRYAFGFDIVTATTSAKNVNLDAADLTDYQDMISKGYTALFVGTATFRGTGCSQTAAYDFSAAAFPKTVNFRFGFTTPVTNINCQNPDNDPASAFDGEEHQRGVALMPNVTTIAQATFHTDHAFWDNFVHDSPAHFDQIAAQYVGVPTFTATVEDLANVTNFSTGFTDKLGAALPWRSCLASFDLTGLPPQMRFDPGTIPVNPGATADQALRNYRDAMSYSESTMGHLNADGLCFVKRNYPSPR